MTRVFLIVTIAVIAGCSPAAGTPTSQRVLANLPIDSLVRSLGAQAGRQGMSVGSGRAASPMAGRFQDTYSTEFPALPASARTLDALARLLRDVADRRGIALVGGRAGDSVYSFTFATDSATGQVEVAATAPTRTGLERYTVVVTEQHRAR